MQRIEKSIRVNAPVSKVYDYWRRFENFPQFMEHVEEVRATDPTGRRSHWKIKGPMGKSVEFDAELTKDEPNKTIGWNSTDGEMGTSGAVTFTDLGENTEVHVVMQWYDPPGGPVGEAASRMLQNPDKMLEEDLQRFKDIAEGRVGSGLRR
jgi:uncharacterized membrane protein